MKVKMKAKDMTRLEGDILGNLNTGYRGCADVKATKLAIGLSHNKRAIKEPLESIRENLQNTLAINMLNQALQEFREANATKSNAEIVEGIAALKKKHPEALRDAEELQRKDKEAQEMEFEIDIYRIPMTYLPGWFDDSVTDPEEIARLNSLGQVPTSALTTLIELGILYDPNVENADGTPK